MLIVSNNIYLPPSSASKKSSSSLEEYEVSGTGAAEPLLDLYPTKSKPESVNTLYNSRICFERHGAFYDTFSE